MPVYHSPGYYGLAWAVIIASVALVALVIVGVVVGELLRFLQ